MKKSTGVVHFNANPFIKIDKNFEYGSVLRVFTHDSGLKQVCGPLKEYRCILRDIHLNPDDIYSYFSHHCGNQPLVIHEDLCKYVKGNRKIVQDFAKEYLDAKGITLDELLRRNTSHTCTELIIYLLCQLYKLRCAIITQDEVWMTLENVGFFEYDIIWGGLILVVISCIPRESLSYLKCGNTQTLQNTRKLCLLNGSSILGKSGILYHITMLQRKGPLLEKIL